MPSSKPEKGVNDLATLFPEVAAEADGWDPSTVHAGSGKKRKWVCEKGHKWEAVVISRRNGHGCPYCSNLKLLVGYNDLQTTFPEIAKQADGWDPKSVIAGNNEKRFWKCAKSHRWEASINKRTQGKGCPYCSNKKVWSGFNDLQTEFPEIAKEADGWDPSNVISGSGKKMLWRCPLGHQYQAGPHMRTSNKTGCPYCANQKVLVGFNDLQTKLPEIAKEANGWDPKTFTAHSNMKLLWTCKLNHDYESSIANRTTGKGCPYCVNKKVLVGYNDIQTKFPEIAKEAVGWDPKTVVPNSGKKLGWRCSKGHQWKASPDSRIGKGTGCPCCANIKVWTGFNDLETKFPEVAKEADGWDPSVVVFSSCKKYQWRCKENHIWTTSPIFRTLGRKTGCPYCSNNKVWSGFNDLETKFPEVAKEADGWDPKMVIAGSNKKMPWKCQKGHQWKAVVSSRSFGGAGCAICGDYGYNPDKPAWFYLMKREGEQQFGITNDRKERLRHHARFGWIEVDITGPHDGKLVEETESALKKWLKKEIGLVPNKRENWHTSNLEVKSLAELKERSGIETSIF